MRTQEPSKDPPAAAAAAADDAAAPRRRSARAAVAAPRGRRSAYQRPIVSLAISHACIRASWRVLRTGMRAGVSSSETEIRSSSPRAPTFGWHHLCSPHHNRQGRSIGSCAGSAASSLTAPRVSGGGVVMHGVREEAERRRACSATSDLHTLAEICNRSFQHKAPAILHNIPIACTASQLCVHRTRTVIDAAGTPWRQQQQHQDHGHDHPGARRGRNDRGQPRLAGAQGARQGD